MMNSSLKFSAFKGLKFPKLSFGNMYSFLSQSLGSNSCLAEIIPTQSQLLSKEIVVSKDIVARHYEEIPKTDSFLGVNWKLLNNLKSLVEFLEKEVKKHGKIFRHKGNPGSPEILFIMDPKDVELVYQAGDSVYPNRFPLVDWMRSRDELKQPYGIFLDENEKWLKQRIPISKYSMMPHKVADFHRPFNEISQALIKYVKEKRGKGNILLDTVSVLNKWSFECVSHFVLGKRLGCLEDPMPTDCQEFVDNIRGIVSTTNKLFIGVPLHKFIRTSTWKNLLKHLKVSYSIAGGLIKSKIEEIEAKEQIEERVKEADLLSHLIYSGKMSIEEVTVNAIDIMAAGIDTTSLTVAACLYCLATNPKVQQKLRKEVQEVVGDDDVVTPTHLHNMPYLRDCVKETQRLYPITVHNGRILQQDVVLSGYSVPAGVPIVMATAVSGRLPEHFPEPEQFIPERWSRRNAKLPNPFMSLPFGFGRRMCVGRRVAELEMHILLAQLVRSFDLKFTEDKPLKYIFNFLYYPEREVNLSFKDMM